MSSLFLTLLNRLPRTLAALLHSSSVSFSEPPHSEFFAPMITFPTSSAAGAGAASSAGAGAASSAGAGAAPMGGVTASSAGSASTAGAASSAGAGSSAGASCPVVLRVDFSMCLCKRLLPLLQTGLTSVLAAPPAVLKMSFPLVPS